MVKFSLDVPCDGAIVGPVKEAIMRNYKPEVQIKKVTANPFAVENIGNLTEEAAIIAVQSDIDAFRYLPEDMQANNNVRLALVDTQGLAIIQFRDTATDEQWHRAVLQNPSVIRFIKKPADDTVWAVLCADATLAVHVQNISEEMKSAAIMML